MLEVIRVHFRCITSFVTLVIHYIYKLIYMSIYFGQHIWPCLLSALRPSGVARLGCGTTARSHLCMSSRMSVGASRMQGASQTLRKKPFFDVILLMWLQAVLYKPNWTKGLDQWHEVNVHSNLPRISSWWSENSQMFLLGNRRWLMTRRNGPWLHRMSWMKWAKSLKNFVHLSEAGALKWRNYWCW